MKDNKTILRESLPSFSITIALLAVIFVFRPPFLTIIYGFVGLTILRSIYKGYKEKFPNGFFKRTALEVISLLFILIPIYFFYEVYGAKGLWSLVAVVLFLTGAIMWRSRKRFVDTLRDIERKHWGETREEKKARLKK